MIASLAMRVAYEGLWNECTVKEVPYDWPVALVMNHFNVVSTQGDLQHLKGKISFSIGVFFKVLIAYAI